MSGEQLLSHTRSLLWRAWANSQEEIASEAASTLLGLGMLVPEGGAAELARLRTERQSTNDAVAAGDVEREGLLKRITELEAAATAEVTAYRAEYTVEGLRLGLYTNEKAAREHCDTLLRREAAGRTWDWAPDEDGDLVQFFVSQLSDRPEETTGYLVTPVTVAAEYDADGDE